MASPVRQARKAAGSAAAVRRPAATLPVAQVAVDMPLPHLDRPFEYLVPESLAETAVPGCRVRVRFSGRLTGGFLLRRTEESEHQGQLGYLERVVSPEPVLTPEIAGLARAVADRYGGTLADVLRLAIPPRHAAAEAARPRPAASGDGSAAAVAPEASVVVAPAEPARPPVPDPGTWARYPAGPSFLAAVAAGGAPRAVWSALPYWPARAEPARAEPARAEPARAEPARAEPGRTEPTGAKPASAEAPSDSAGAGGWAAEIAIAAASAASAGRGVVIVVPDARDLQRLDSALSSVLAPGSHVILSASLGPAERYRRWLKAARGQVAVVAGTRSTMFAPVRDLGLVVLWDEGDDLLTEPRAPYPRAREVLAMRAHRAGAAALIGGFARTAEAAQLVTASWAHSLQAARDTVRRWAPSVLPAGDDAELARDEAARSARLPSLALRSARAALASGPVLFQVPRRGYLAAVACENCHAQARCPCGGPVQLAGARATPRCGWCGSVVSRPCPECGHSGLRALVTGASRTAEELGRAFPAVPVLTSGGSRVLAQVPGSPAVVVATPGAEPTADGGYAAAVLLDGWALLGRASLRAAEEAVRRWMNAAALVRPGADGGTVVVVADASLPAVQALVRWDPATFAERELGDRQELRFPPAARMAALSGPHNAVRALLDAAQLPPGAEVLGPVAIPEPPGSPAGPDADQARFLVRTPRSQGGALAAALRAGQAARSARKDAAIVRLELDPAELI